jgi:hypothetical protein
MEDNKMNEHENFIFDAWVQYCKDINYPLPMYGREVYKDMIPVYERILIAENRI